MKQLIVCIVLTLCIGILGISCDTGTNTHKAASLQPPEYVYVSLNTDSPQWFLEISWSDVSAATGYAVHRAAEKNGPYTRLTADDITGQTYRDTDANWVSAAAWYYKVEVRNAKGEKVLSDSVSWPAVSVDGEKSEIPTAIRSGSLSASRITLMWEASEDTLFCKIYGVPHDAGTFTFLNVSPRPAYGSWTYTDTGLTPETEYLYAISAVGIYGEGELSAPFSATTTPQPDLDWELVGYLPMTFYDYYASWHSASVKDGEIILSADDAVFVSGNGMDWTKYTIYPSENLYNRQHRTVVFDNKLWTLGGFKWVNLWDEYLTVNNTVSWSSDNRSFTVVEPVNGLSGGIIDFAVFVLNGSMWVCGGETALTYDDRLTTNKIWRSSNGTTWTEQTMAAGFSSRAGHAVAVFNNGVYLAGGYEPGGETNYADVLFSDDGTNWTTLTTDAPWGARNNHTLIADSQGLWLIGGGNSARSVYYNDVWFSEDGINWTEKKYNAFPPRGWHTSVIKDGFLYVIGGITGTETNTTYLRDIWRVYVGD